MTHADSSPLARPDFGPALAAARAAAGPQHYPAGTLYMVATPIGNLADVSLRALHVLQLADAIACEDTRHTQQLLRAYGIDGKPLLPLHEHNEAEAAQAVLERLRQGQRVAYVSDAGTPAVSDPGARLVAAVRAGGAARCPAPAAWRRHQCGGRRGGQRCHRFRVRGLPAGESGERATAVQRLAAEPRAVVPGGPHRRRRRAGALADAR